MSVDKKKITEDLFEVLKGNEELREGFLKDPISIIKNNIKEDISEEDAKNISEELNKRLDGVIDPNLGAAAALGSSADSVGKVFPGSAN